MALTCCCHCGGDLAPGHYFRPTDSDLLGYFLYNKVNGYPIIDEKRLVPKIDFYGPSAKDPWRIWEDFGGQSLPIGENLHFFTTLKLNSKSKAKAASQVKSKASRVSRKAGDDGCWHEEHAAEVTHRMTNKPFGIKKRFLYKNCKSSQDGCWIMFEFSLKDYPAIVDEDEGQLVLCQLRKNETKLQKNEKKRKRDEPAIVDDDQGQIVLCQLPKNEAKLQKNERKRNEPAIVDDDEGQLVLCQLPKSEAKLQKNERKRNEPALVDDDEEGALVLCQLPKNEAKLQKNESPKNEAKLQKNERKRNEPK